MIPFVNSAWHYNHPLPKDATLDQRMDWHLEHVEHCNCRDIPARLKEQIRKRARVKSLK